MASDDSANVFWLDFKDFRLGFADGFWMGLAGDLWLSCVCGFG
jgi:hypothetical protein